MRRFGRFGKRKMTGVNRDSGVKDHSQTSGGLQADWAWFCDRFGFGYEEDDGIEGGGVLLNSNLCVTGIGQTA